MLILRALLGVLVELARGVVDLSSFFLKWVRDVQRWLYIFKGMCFAEDALAAFPFYTSLGGKSLIPHRLMSTHIFGLIDFVRLMGARQFLVLLISSER